MKRTLSDQHVNPAFRACYPTTATRQCQRIIAQAFNNRLLLFIVSLLFFSGAFAQITTTFPSANSCTSKDLQLVGARITGGDPCNSCEPNTSVTRTLTLSINNTTKSTRASFAFWGTLERTGADGKVITSDIKGCGGPIERGIINNLDYGEVTYNCGDAIKIKNLFLAWTDASDKSTCASLNSATINPKCGTLPEIVVNVGVNGNLSQTNLTCYGASNGAINLSAFGGAGPYTFSWSASEGGAIPTGQANNEDLTGLRAGTYTVTITDTKNCSITRSRTITGPASGLSIGACSKDDVTCSGGNNGAVRAGAVSNNVGTPQYSWKNGSNNVVGTSANVSNLAAGTYTLTVTDNCSSLTRSVTVGAPPALPAPSAAVSQQPTCTSGVGSVSVSDPDANTTYTLLQGGAVKYTAVSGVFSGVVPGTYSLGAAIGTCTSTGNNVTVNAQPLTPPTPYIVISKYPDCSSAQGTLQVKLNANTNYSNDYEFSSDGETFVDGNEFSFTAGQGYQVYVRTKGTTCVTSAVCEGQTAGRPGQSNTTQLSPVKLPVMDIVESELKVKAYPNPFNQRINFVVSSPVSGRGSLEVYNGMGQKVKTVYVGMISRGSQTFELTLPANKTSNLLYVLRVGNQRITGKILQLNR